MRDSRYSVLKPLQRATAATACGSRYSVRPAYRFAAVASPPQAGAKRKRAPLSHTEAAKRAEAATAYCSRYRVLRPLQRTAAATVRDRRYRVRPAYGGATAYASPPSLRPRQRRARPSLRDTRSGSGIREAEAAVCLRII
jgi:hypothetical protein